jgi:hypothetical protein
MLRSDRFCIKVLYKIASVLERICILVSRILVSHAWFQTGSVLVSDRFRIRQAWYQKGPVSDEFDIYLIVVSLTLISQNH